MSTMRLLTLLVLVTASACKQNEPPPAPPPPPVKAVEPTPPTPPAPPPPAAEVVPSAEAAPAKKGLDPAKLTEKAPAKYKAKFTTSKGAFVIEVNRDWAPMGADRFYNLVKSGYFDGVKFFRTVKGFMVQFGIHGDPKMNEAWREASIKDDPVKESNKRGTVSFAMKGPDTRTTQLFINYGDNSRLDQMGFPPFGKVASGMNVVDSLHGEYGEAPSQQQGRIQDEGNAFLDKEYPQLDSVKKAEIVR